MTEPSSRANLTAPFDSLTLRAVIAELRQRLLGGQVQDIRQPSQSELRLGIRSQGRNHNLALSCDARFARAHLTAHRPPNAPVPPSFCMALRKHCEGAVVRDIRQRGFDRVLEIEIVARSDDADSTTTTLIAELMGKHSNLILVNAAGIILEAAKRVSRKVNRFREVLPGLPYQMPPEQADRLDPFDSSALEILERELNDESGGSLKAMTSRLTDRVAGMSPFLAENIVLQWAANSLLQFGGEGAPREVGEREGSHEVRASALAGVWQGIFGAASKQEFQPVAIVAVDRTVGAYPFPPAQIPPEALQRVDDLNAALDEGFSGAVLRASSSTLVSELRGVVDRDRKRLIKQKLTKQ